MLRLRCRIQEFYWLLSRRYLHTNVHGFSIFNFLFVRNLDDDNDSDDDITMETHAETPDTKKLLWVEKYAPYNYTDLLSEEV